MLERIHHINLLVRDLDAAVRRYTNALGVEDWVFGELPGRGVRTARFRAGDSWVVLVQPTDDSGVPGRHLAEHGEGLFLLSFGVAELDAVLAGLDAGDPGRRLGARGPGGVAGSRPVSRCLLWRPAAADPGRGG